MFACRIFSALIGLMWLVWCVWVFFLFCCVAECTAASEACRCGGIRQKAIRNGDWSILITFVFSLSHLFGAQLRAQQKKKQQADGSGGLRQTKSYSREMNFHRNSIINKRNRWLLFFRRFYLHKFIFWWFSVAEQTIFICSTRVRPWIEWKSFSVEHF